MAERLVSRQCFVRSQDWLLNFSESAGYPVDVSSPGGQPSRTRLNSDALYAVGKKNGTSCCVSLFFAEDENVLQRQSLDSPHRD